MCSQQEEEQRWKKVGKTYIRRANISQNSPWGFHLYVIGQNCVLQQSLTTGKLGNVVYLARLSDPLTEWDSVRKEGGARYWVGTDNICQV